MSKYKVSVIVPVYNVDKYIDKCLKSLVMQTLQEIEIIVVNDGSPDNSQKIIDKYAKKYPEKIKSYITENGGVGSARNFGLTKATGEYIGYVDSDDFVEINMFEELYNKAKKDDLDIVICGSYNVDEKTEKKQEDIDKRVFEDPYLNAFFGRPAVWNKLYKKSVINNIKFRTRKWYEDLDYTLKALSNANKIGYVDKPLYNYLIRPGSIMNNNNLERNLEILDTFDEINKYKNLENNKEIIEFLAVNHIFIVAVVRVINSEGTEDKKKNCINKLKCYVKDNYPNFEKNKYLYLLSKNSKIIYKLIRFKQYKIVKLIFKIKRG